MSNYLDLTIKDNDLPIIVIDHHENNKIENSEATYIDTDASSTGVLVYRLIKQFPEITNESVKSKISTCLLTTIITDNFSKFSGIPKQLIKSKYYEQTFLYKVRNQPRS